MQLVSDKPAIIITPNKELVDRLTKEIIEIKGAFALDEVIKEELGHNVHFEGNHSFTYTGLYTSPFRTQAEALDFKEAIEQLVTKTNNNPEAINIKDIDDVLFITLLYYSYSGEGSSLSSKEIYLNQLADVYVQLSNRKLTPTDGDHIWIQDAFTGIPNEIPRSSLSQAELLDNDGYKVYSHIIHPTKQRHQYIPNDGKVVIQPVYPGDQQIELPERLAEHLTDTMLRYIIKEHSEANTDFYKDLIIKDFSLFEWEKNNPPKKHKRENRALSKLIVQLESYLKSKNKSSYQSQCRIFIYDLLAILKLMPLPPSRKKEALPESYKEQISFHSMTPPNKYGKIKDILKHN